MSRVSRFTIRSKETSLQGYFQRFPEKIKTELQVVGVPESGFPGFQLPPGVFHFFEFFCTERGCDCQRLLVKVIRRNSDADQPREFATISYTWNKTAKREWAEVNQGMPNPFLDPLHRQHPSAEEFLRFWEIMVQEDAAYRARLIRHYHELRESCGCKVPQPALVLSKQDRRERQRKLEQFNRQRKAR